MKTKFKIIILILLILLIASGFIILNIQETRSAVLREYTSNKERLTRENQELAGKLTDVMGVNKYLQETLENIKGDLESASSERGQIQSKYDLINAERNKLLEKLDVYSQMQEDWEAFSSENQSLKEQVEAINSQNLALQTDLNKLRKENESLRQKIEEAKAFLEEKAILAGYAKEQESGVAREIQTAQSSRVRSVDLPPIVVSPFSVSSKTNLPFSLTGKILNVNKEYNFIVIDLGQDKGVKEGMVFEVIRDERLIGKVEVIQPRLEIAACDIIEANLPFEIGDTVRY
ncbi:MAG: hypothetical protein ABH914_04650 [Candidatus Omnitrophota bacterium]